MKLLLILSILITSIFALTKDEIPKTMQEKINQAVFILQKDNNKSAANKLFDIFDPVFDYELMARLSLSKAYNKLNKEEKIAFNEAFEAHLKKSFVDKLTLYKNENIKIIKNENVKKRYFLTGAMLINGKNQNIIFKFSEKNNNWLIYDIDIFGISIIQSYRSQFADLLDNADFDTLLKTLNKTTFDK